MQNSQWFGQISKDILQEVTEAEKQIGSSKNNEFISTVTDLRILANLSLYYSRRIPAAVNYNLFKLTGNVSSLDDAINEEQNAINAWEQIVQSASDVYTDDIMMGVRELDFCGSWKDELAALKKGLEKLKSDRAALNPFENGKTETFPQNGRIVNDSSDNEPPEVTFSPVTKAKPLQSLRITVHANDPSGIKWVRLRYRHVTQFEDYNTIEMKPEGREGVYSAEIPGDFIIPKWDVMYFIEAMDNADNGKMYPSFEKGIPYIIVSLER